MPPHPHPQHHRRHLYFRRQGTDVEGQDKLDREKLSRRLKLEVDLLISCSRLAVFVFTIIFTVLAIYGQRSLDAEAKLNRQIQSEFSFEDLAGTFTSEEALWQYIDGFAETSRSFMPLSSTYIRSSSDRILIGKPRKFNIPSVMPIELQLGAAWSFTAWAQALQSGLEAALVTRSLPTGGMCWGWSYPGRFLYGEHEFGTSGEESRTFTGGASFASSKAYQLVALVFNGSHLQFFTHNSTFLTASDAQPIPTTGISDCELGVLRVGDRGLRLAQVQFFGRALDVLELEEISRFGQPFGELALGQEPNRADDEIESADIVTQELLSVQYKLGREVRSATSKLEALHVTNVRSIEQTIRDLVDSTVADGSRRLAHDSSGTIHNNSAASGTVSTGIAKNSTEQLEMPAYTEYFTSGYISDGKKEDIIIPLGTAPKPYFSTASGARAFAFSGFVKSRLETPMLSIYAFYDGIQLESKSCQGLEYGASSKSTFMYNSNRNLSRPVAADSSWNGNTYRFEWDLPPAKNIKKPMWRHVAVTVEDVQFTAYYDGQILAKATMDEPLTDCERPILRLQLGDGLHEKPQGYGKLRFWKRMPSVDEIFSESLDTTFRECKLLQGGEVFDDSVWLTTNGHSCAWFASKVRANTDMQWCTNIVKEKCPVACQVHTYCYTLPPKQVQIFPDTLRFDRDTLCLGKDVDVERMLQECLAWTSKPKRRLHDDWKNRILYDTSCEVFKEALRAGEYCRFDQQPFIDSLGGQPNQKPDQFTIAFWSRHFSRGFASGAPGWSGTWATHCKVFPDQFEKYVDGDMVYIDRTGFEFVYDPNGTRDWDYSYYPEHSVGKDSDDWLFHSVSYDATQPSDKKWSMLVGRNYAEVAANAGEPTVCSIPEAFTFSMEKKGVATGDARLASFRFFNKRMSRGELQYMMYQEQDDYISADARPGPAAAVAEMKVFASQVVQRYSNAAVFLVPPLITSSQLEAVPCKGTGRIFAERLKKRLSFQELRLQPFCSAAASGLRSELMQENCPKQPDEVVTCSGQLHSTSRFFGIDTTRMMHVWPHPVYTELLYSLSAPLLVRDGETFVRERYITAQTDWVSLLALPYDSDSMTVGILRVDLHFSGTKHVRAVPSLRLIGLGQKGEVFYIVAASVFVLLDMILLLAWALYARQRTAQTPRLVALRSPWALMRSLIYTAFPAVFLVVRYIDLESRLGEVETFLADVLSVDFGNSEPASQKVLAVEKGIDAMVNAMDAEAWVRLVTFFVLFFMFVRMLGFMKAHSRIAVIVTTLEDSLDDVFHFMFSLFSVLILFGIIGMYSFGAEMQEFSSIGSTSATISQMAIGDAFPWNPHGESLASSIFIASFVMIVMFLLVNALLGIVLTVFDRQKEAVDSDGTDQNIMMDLCDMISQIYWRTPKIRILEALEDTAESFLSTSLLAQLTTMSEEKAAYFYHHYAGFAQCDDVESPGGEGGADENPGTSDAGTQEVMMPAGAEGGAIIGDPELPAASSSFEQVEPVVAPAPAPKPESRPLERIITDTL